jgi:hypothetical protein
MVTSIDIAADAALAWTLLADPRLVPEWIAGVADAEPIDHDEHGRPLRVTFVGMPSTASIEYVVAYSYDDAARTIRWSTLDGAERSILGQASVEDLGGGRCRFHYELVTRTARTLPQWAKDTLADDTPERVVRAFQRFVERRTPLPT